MEVRTGGVLLLIHSTITRCGQGVHAYAGARQVVVRSCTIRECRTEGILAAGSDPNAATRFQATMREEVHGCAAASSESVGRQVAESAAREFAGQGIPLELFLEDCLIENGALYGVSIDGSIVNASLKGCTLGNTAVPKHPVRLGMWDTSTPINVFAKGAVSLRISACHFFHGPHPGVRIGVNYGGVVHLRHSCFVGQAKQAVVDEVNDPTNVGVPPELSNVARVVMGFWTRAPIREDVLVMESADFRAELFPSIDDLLLRCPTLNRLQGDNDSLNLPLERCARWTRRVIRHDRNPIYYAIGNIPGFNMAQSISTSTFNCLERIDILLAETRDIRNIVRTAMHLMDSVAYVEKSRDVASKPADVPLTFICQDESASLLARIILLLALIDDGPSNGVETSDVLAIWSNVGLTDKQHAVLNKKLALLAGGEFPSWLCVSSASSLVRIRNIFQSWSLCTVSLETVIKQRLDYFKDPQLLATALLASTNALPGSLATSIRKEQCSPLINSITTYVQTGTLACDSGSVVCQLNPTMLEAPDLQFNLYFTSSILRAVQFDIDGDGDGDGDTYTNVGKKCWKPGCLFGLLCQILRPQFDATRKMLKDSSTKIGVLDCSVHEFAFAIPTIYPWHGNGQNDSLSVRAFDIIDFSNLADYDGFAPLLQIAHTRLKDLPHASCILHARKTNILLDQPSNSEFALSNGAILAAEGLLIRTIGFDGDMIARFLELRMTQAQLNSEQGLLSMWFMRHSRAATISADSWSSALNSMCKRFLTIPFHRPELFASGLFGCGASAMLRFLQLALPRGEPLSMHIPSFLNTMGGKLHAAELRALALLQDWNDGALVENDLGLLTFKSDVQYYKLGMYTECLLQLVITQERLCVPKGKHPTAPPADSVMGLIDSFSFHAESGDVSFYLAEEDRCLVAPCFVTLCTTRDMNSDLPSRAAKFDIVAPSVRISDIPVRRTFDVMKWGHSNQPSPHMARVRPSWLQWKKEGNAAFKSGRYREAKNSYTIAMRADNDLLATLLLHISFCLLETNQPKLALSSGLAALALDSTNFLSSLVVAAALSALGDESSLFAAAAFREDAARQVAMGHPLSALAAPYPCMSNAHHGDGFTRHQPTPISTSPNPDSPIVLGVVATLSMTTELEAVADNANTGEHAGKLNAFDLLRFGVSLVESGEYVQALTNFRTSLDLVKSRSVLLTNRAQCHSKLAPPSSQESWLLDSTAAIAIDPTPKAKLRQAEAFQARRRHEEVKRICTNVLELGAPMDAAVRYAIMDLNRWALAALGVSPSPSLASSPASSSPQPTRPFARQDKDSFASAAMLRQSHELLRILCRESTTSHSMPNFADVSDFPAEIRAVPESEWPIELNRDDCLEDICVAYEKSCWYSLDTIRFESMESDHFLEHITKYRMDELAHRLGTITPARLKWYSDACPGTVQFGRELLTAWPQTPVHSFGNQCVRPHFVSLGTTHVAIGPQHIDLGCLAATMFDPASLEEGKGTHPLRFVGFGPHAVCVAKSLLIAHMLKLRRPSDTRASVIESILEVWYSASIKNRSLDALRRAATELLEAGRLESDVKLVLTHWLSSHVPLSKARNEWRRATHALPKAPNLNMKADRLDYCFYALSGDLIPADHTSLGNITMFDIPPQFGERNLDERIFDQLSLHELLRRRCAIGEKGTILDAARDILRDRIGHLYDMVAKSQVIIEFRIGCFDTQRDSVITAIRDLQPWTIFWSNMPDYLPPAQFHEIAQRCSRSEDTIHYAASLNWTCDVKGTSLLDFPPRETRQEVIRMFTNYYVHIRNGKLPAAWPIEFGKYIRSPSIDHTNNIVNFLLSPPFHKAWHEAFFARERVGHAMAKSQYPLCSAVPSTYSPFSQRLAQLSFTFTYDPTVKLEIPAGSNCMRPGCTSRVAQVPIACQCFNMTYCTSRCQQADLARHRENCRPFGAI